MCDCLSKSEKKIQDHLVETKGLTNVDEAGYDNVVFCFDGKVPRKVVLPFTVTYIPIKKDGTDGKEKKYRTSIFPAFCPFCGVKVE